MMYPAQNGNGIGMIPGSTPNQMQMMVPIGGIGGIDTKSELLQPEIDKEKEKQARENHCEIERRRRVKMAAYFNELCIMVPTCNNLQRKPDKLTILRMASSHMRNLRGNHTSVSNDNAYKPSFLTDQELKHLILEAADGFLFVAQCDTGNIIYVSDAVQPVLCYSPNEWNHRSLFDFVHQEDLEKVKDQLSTQENSSNNTTGRILDLKTGTVKKEGHPNSMRSHIGSRRSFICRIKIGAQNSQLQQIQAQPQLVDSNNQSLAYWSTNSRLSRNRNTLQTNQELTQDPLKSQYSVVHITGYTKVWPPNASSSSSSSSANLNNVMDHSQQHLFQSQQHSMHHQQQQQHHHQLDDPSLNQNLNPNQTNFHLIAIARIQMTSAPTDLVHSSNAEFVTRHDQNGLITFVDQRVTSLLGYQPNEMLKKSLIDFCIPHDQLVVKEQLKQIYESKITQPVNMTIHFIPANNMQEVIPFKTSAYAFCNPCNEAFEFIVCTHVSQNRFNEQTTNTNLLNSMNANLNCGVGVNSSLLNSNASMNTNGSSSNNLLNSASMNQLDNTNLNSQYSQYHLNQYNHLSQPQTQHQQSHLISQQSQSLHHQQLNYSQLPQTTQLLHSNSSSNSNGTSSHHHSHQQQTSTSQSTSNANSYGNFLIMQNMNSHDPYASSLTIPSLMGSSNSSTSSTSSNTSATPTNNSSSTNPSQSVNNSNLTILQRANNLSASTLSNNTNLAWNSSNSNNYV